MQSGFLRTSRPEVETVDLRAAARKRLPFVPALGTDEAIAAWRERMIDADGAAREMARLASALFRSEHAVHASACESLAREERKLAILAGGAVEALGGAAVFHVDAGPTPVADDDSETPAEWLFRAFGTAALTATAIATRLGVARALMPSGDLLALVTRMHHVESDRARVTWEIAKPLAETLSFDARVRTAQHLSHVFAETEVRTATLAGSSAPTSDEELALGFVHGPLLRRAFYRTMKGNVIPKLERAGIRADLAWAGRASIFDSISA